jgi:hypothetical protein
VVNATPRPLYSRERDSSPTAQEATWDPRPIWRGAENLAPTDTRSPDRPALSESLYRLNYRDPPVIFVPTLNLAPLNLLHAQTTVAVLGRVLHVSDT